MKLSTSCSPFLGRRHAVLGITLKTQNFLVVCRLLSKEHEELVVRPIVLRDIPDGGCRAQTHNIPRIQRRPHSFPTRPSPFRRTVAQTRDLRTQTFAFISIFQTVQRLRQCCQRTFKVFFPWFQSGSGSILNVNLMCSIVKFILSVLCLCH